MTRYLLLHSPMDCGRGSFCSFYTKMTRRPCQSCFIELLSTWTLKTRYLLERRNPRRGKGKKMHDKTGDGRRPKPEINGRIGALSPRLEDLRTSPRWLPLSIKSWYRSRMMQPWCGPASWREIPIRGPETNIAVFIETTVTTRLNAMTWSSRLKPLLDKGNYNDSSIKKG